MVATLEAEIERLVRAEHDDPFAILGPHAAEGRQAGSIVVRTIQPSAASVELLSGGRSTPMTRRHAAGLFEASLIAPPGAPFPDYRLRVAFDAAHVHEIDDAYRYGRVLTDFDLHLLSEGTHYRAFEKLGAHRLSIGPASGIHFAVWAPNARRVSVVGDFNGWDPRVHPMRRLQPNGVWELFVPDLRDGQKYKFDILAASGATRLKADPYGVFFEGPPNSAAIIWTTAQYSWQDDEWMRERRERDSGLERPMAIYEVHLGSWRHALEPADRSLTYKELARELVPYVKKMGYTHIELLPVMEHPFAGSWGYQVIGFFAPTSRFGTPEDFKALVDECHVQGLGVILDWVPGHFPADDYALARFDGTALYEHEDPRQGLHQDWGTLIFNYARHEVRNFLLSSALFWLEQFHVDGLRVDAVASMLYLDYSRQPGQWVPNKFGGRENLDAIDFLRDLNTQTHAQHPGTITAAEESTSWPGVSRPTYVGGLGFTFKWDMGWMHDILKYMQQDPIHRPWSHNHLTFSMLYAYSENFILPFSHDEVVYGKGSMLNKMPGDAWQKAANLRALYAFMYGHPGKKLMFMGSEFGQWREWNHDVGLDWHLLDQPLHAGLQRFVSDLNGLYGDEASLFEQDFMAGGFTWIDCADHENSVVSFIRRARDAGDFTVFVLNFTPVVREGYRIGVPAAGPYLETLNSDASKYGGSNLGNRGSVSTDAVPAHGYPQSLSLLLPPLAGLVLKPDVRIPRA